MTKFIELHVNEVVASGGGRAWRKLSADVSNFILSDGSTLVTADGQTFNAKENNL